MQLDRRVADAARLLAIQAEVANKARMRGIGQIVDLRHAPRAPAVDARDEIRDSGVAFPPIFVRALERADPADQRRFGRVGHIPNLVCGITERTQQIELPTVSFGKIGAAAHAHHLRATALAHSLFARDMSQVSGRARIRDVEDRCAIEFGNAGERVHGLGYALGAAVVPDVRDPAPVLLFDDRLVRASRLQVLIADQLHVPGFGPGGRLRLRERASEYKRG
jgi:hypothetical protein